jgi:hypothetical protein
MHETPQHRRRRIRRTVGVASLATFAVAWGTIAGTGAMGHGSSVSSTATTASAQSTSSWQDDDDQQQQQLPAMTTQQS